ncbi:MAG: carboxypeptidase regulatory-like domain-containing protein [Bacteroidales bacterium]|nr:carboxypeptidase regulatory-like domain-containing protein [Bacteroidales bacterium]
MTITKEGGMYAIALDGSLYSINTTTWVATEVGSTGIELMDMGFPHAMAADYRSGKLYWNYLDMEEEMGIAEVDAITGEATPIGTFDNYLSCMASLYYPANNPQSIADFALSYENAKVKANFTVPALTVNGDEISQLDTIEIYKVVGNSVVGRVWAQQNPTPGQKISQELENLGSNGETVTLAIRVKDNNGKYSSFETASVLLFNVTLPYVNGFETDAADPMAAVVFPNVDGMGRITTEKHTGSYGFKMTGTFYRNDQRRVTIQGMPVKKGGVYAVSLWAKTNASKADKMVYAFDGASQYSILGDVSSSEWTQLAEMYEATATGQMSFTLQGYGNVLTEEEAATVEYYLDDIEVKELVSPDVPAPFTFNSVTAAPNGALQAIMNITLPSETMAEETLSKIDSIVFYISTSYMFPDIVTTKATVKEGLTPGATTNITVDMPKAGNYYIRAVIYNEKGSCPYYSNYVDETGKSYQKTPWIGSDLPASVKVTATPGTDGTVALEWLAPTALHQGYIGTVTYKLKDAAGTELYNGSNLTFTTSALALGMHAFTLEFSDDAATKSFNFNTLAGIQQGMIYSNVSTAGTTNARVLNVSAESANSAFAQMLYPATNQAMYIDTLLLFATAPEEGEAKQYTKIYMGTTDLTAFGGNAMAPARDFVEKSQLTEVFADTLRFKAGENMLKLPLKGFYYNGTQTLVIGVVKPMQESTTFAAAAYVAVSENNMLKYRATSTEIDFDTVKAYNDYTGTPNNYAVSMVAAPGADLKTLNVTVDSMGVTPLEGAIITIVNKGGKNMNTTITTSAAGTVSFTYMPQGVYTVKAQKAGYIASEQEVTVEETSPVAVSFSLVKAKEVKVSGTVQDKGGNMLVNVAVKATGLADFDATTNADGEFELQNVYGPGEYTLSFEKVGMRTLSIPFVLGEKDTTLAKPFEMGYNIVGIPMASVIVEDGNAVVNWTIPSVSSMVTWTSTFNQTRRLTIDNKTPFKYAQRFLPEDLAELSLGNTPKALRFSFMVGSETAQYSIVLAADTTHEIYRAEVPADKLKEGEWCNIDIPAESAAIDVTKELWLIVEVSGEDQGYACAATTTGTINKKGNLMYYKNKWCQIQELFTNSSVPGNVLIRLLVEDASTQAVPANGYRVYRGLLKDEFKDYTLLTETTVNTTTYTDAAYAALPFGQYNYAVVSDWYGDDLSQPTYTNTLNKDMEFTVAFKVTSNAGSAKDAIVYMVDTARTRDYEAVVNDKDTATIAKKVWRDVYDYEITLPYHQTVTGQLNLTQDTVINVSLQEIVLNPELTASVEGKDVVVNYGVNLHNWFDDVESYEDFAIANIGDYILSEPTDKGGIKDVSWTNMGEEQSWIVFNPTKTKPAVNLPAHSGNKMFAAFYNAYPQGVEAEANNDYLIRPVSKGGGAFIFYCRAYSNQMPESFEVVYSSTTADLSAFKTVQAYKNVTVTSWTPVAVEIPEDAKFVGIHCTSYDAFIFLVDDLAYYTEDPANPTGYELYLDGTKVKDAKADELTYTFQNLDFGEHKVGVKAIYASGASELVEKTVKISAEAKPVNLNVAVEERTAVLTWNMPEGFAPKSYKVFLGEELKAENLTEKTYTFNDLKNGTYTAAVVAVYESGESEKATVEFIINSHVDVEGFDMAVRSSVYPNPNDGMFYLKAADKGTVEVYAMNGQLVKRVEIPAPGTYSINLQNRAKGLYLMKFATRENTTLFKVVVR